MLLVFFVQLLIMYMNLTQLMCDNWEAVFFTILRIQRYLVGHNLENSVFFFM